jgi:hypothetical protein
MHIMDIYRVFVERQNRHILFPFASTAETPPSSAEKRKSHVDVDTPRVLNTFAYVYFWK